QELLKEAQATYEQMLRQFPNRPDVQAAARISLASVEESLATLIPGGDGKRARALYQQVIDKKPNAYAEWADKKLKDLDDRLRPRCHGCRICRNAHSRGGADSADRRRAICPRRAAGSGKDGARFFAGAGADVGGTGRFDDTVEEDGSGPIAGGPVRNAKGI